MKTRLILTGLASLAVLATPFAATAATASPKPVHHLAKHKVAKKVTTTTTTTTATKPASK